jgi:hypothetical protein
MREARGRGRNRRQARCQWGSHGDGTAIADDMVRLELSATSVGEGGSEAETEGRLGKQCPRRQPQSCMIQYTSDLTASASVGISRKRAAQTADGGTWQEAEAEKGSQGF